jgi:hypothetical protein
VISLESLTAKLKLIFARSEFSEAEKLLNGLKKTAAVVGAAWGAIKLGGVVSGWVADTQAAAAAAENMASTFNVSAEKIQIWGYGAVSAGANSEALAGTLRALSRTMQNARTNGMDPAVMSLRKLGVTGDVIRRQDLGAALEQIGDQLASGKLAGKGEMAHLMAAVGDEATKLVPWLRQGSAGMEALADEAVNFGAVMSDETLARMRELRGETRRLDAAFTGLKREVALAVVPALLSAAQRGTELARRFSGPIAAAIRTVGAVVMPVVEALREHLGRAISFVVDVVTGLWGSLQNLIRTVRESAAAATVGGAAWDVLRKVAGVVAAVFKVVWQTLRLVGAVVAAVVKTVWGFVESIVSLADRFGVLAFIIGTVKVGLHIVKSIFEGVADVVRQLAEGFLVLGDWGIEAARAIGAAMHEALDWVVETLHDVLDALGLIKGTDDEEAKISRYNQLRVQGLDQSAAWEQASKEIDERTAGGVAQPAVNVGDPWAAMAPPPVDIGPWGSQWTPSGPVNVEIKVNSEAPAAAVADEVQKRFREELTRVQARTR